MKTFWPIFTLFSRLVWQTLLLRSQGSADIFHATKIRSFPSNRVASPEFLVGNVGLDLNATHPLLI